MTTVVRDFERTILAFVAEGSGLEPKYVYPWQRSAPTSILNPMPPCCAYRQTCGVAYPVRYQQSNGTTSSI